MEPPTDNNQIPFLCVIHKSTIPKKIPAVGHSMVRESVLSVVTYINYIIIQVMVNILSALCITKIYYYLAGLSV